MKFSQSIKIGSKTIGGLNPVFIIAEAGVNHGGDITIAKQLIDIAATAGADAVKFQAFRTEHLILKDIQKAPYQRKTTDHKETQFEMLQKLELAKESYMLLKEYCDSKGIIFLITPFDEKSLEELEEINLAAYKVASTDTTNFPFLEKIAKTGKPIFLSTGMCFMDEVEGAVELISGFNKDLVLLQCTANYPIRDDEANLKVVSTYLEKFRCLVGYSDHSVGIGASPFAVPMGACVVEKHFTIDKSELGPDHLASLDPEELREYVNTIRRVEQYLGTGIKRPTDSEQQTRNSLQKCLVASKNIYTGEEFTEFNIVAKRTGGTGISPMRFKEIKGKKSVRDFLINEIIEI